jgi:hypothetical protein
MYNAHFESFETVLEGGSDTTIHIRRYCGSFEVLLTCLKASVKVLRCAKDECFYTSGVHCASVANVSGMIRINTDHLALLSL